MESIGVTALLELDQTEAVEGFDVVGLDFERGFVIAFGQIEAVGAELSGAELDPTIRRVRLDVGITGELLDGAREIVLILIKTAEIEARGGKFVVKSDGLAIGADGQERLVVAVIG